MSTHLKNISCPGETNTLGRVTFEIVVRLVGALPSSGPPASPTFGLAKSRAFTAVHVTVFAGSGPVIGELLIRYENASVCVAVLPPLRHCSPVYETMKF